MTRLFLALLLLLSLQLRAQKTEEAFDASFKPTKGYPRYYVITEAKGDHWFREAYYIPEKSLAMKGSYKDQKCSIPDGEVTWYFSNKTLQYNGSYTDGKKQGPWLQFHENGMIMDSAFYVDGHLKGIRLGWNEEGYQIDSSFFDGQGNGSEVHWFANGPVSSAGFVSDDTNKVKRWNYYHPNGALMATEDYVNGERTACSCFTEAGQRLDSCIEQEARFPGDAPGELKAWLRFVQRNLNPDVPVRKGAPEGLYTTMVRFVVNTDGRLSDIIPLTKFGFGMEEEVIRMLKLSPRWVPAFQFGKKVKAYRKQPVSFMVSKG